MYKKVCTISKGDDWYCADGAYSSNLKEPEPQYAYITDACKHCPNHPSNGGSGVCNCSLGVQTMY